MVNVQGGYLLFSLKNLLSMKEKNKEWYKTSH